MPVMNGIEIQSLAQEIDLLRADPALGRQTFTAEAVWDGATVTGRNIPNAKVQGSGGDCLYAEELLCVLAKCVAYDFVAHGGHLGVDTARVRVIVHGDIDLGGSVGLDAPAGFTAFRIEAAVATSGAPRAVETLGGIVQRTSIVAQSLAAIPQAWNVHKEVVA